MTRVYKWTTGGAELLLGIPFIGGAFILSTGWSALGVMLVVHILGLVLSIKRNSSRVGHSMGIAASILGVIPVLGMILHLIVGLILVFEAIQEEQARDVLAEKAELESMINEVKGDETIVVKEETVVVEEKK